MPKTHVLRVICASVARVESSPVNVLLTLRNDFCQKNVRARSAWLYTHGWFVGWFEGARDAVENGIAIAASDTRNAGQRIVHRSTGPATLAQPISVVATQSQHTPTEFARGIEWLRRSPLAQEEPLAVWRRLSEPCVAPGHGTWSALPDHDVAYVAADPNASLDELRKLGERHGSPVVYQRFANARLRSGDVGAAYVDVPHRDGFTRVRLVSRRSLEQPMLRTVLDATGCTVRDFGSFAAPEPGIGVTLYPQPVNAWMPQTTTGA
ncbi:hypothetical protein [Ramlibacter albus]|uniref:Uncharacterized protein n=1 Tax=Ramlibacter albus TaxID=2079448 RepID=A0A923MEY8_9BURK|nr:hypothetical protein [Ramlibacter albus]MBC5768044.1 hypothetical protein [Ramlibacter albus]